MDIQPLLGGADLLYAISVASINYNLKYNDATIQTEKFGVVQLYTSTGAAGTTKLVSNVDAEFEQDVIAPWKETEAILKSDAEAGDHVQYQTDYDDALKEARLWDAGILITKMDKPQIAVRPDGVILCIFHFTDATVYTRPREKTGDFLEYSTDADPWTFAFPIEITPVSAAYGTASSDCQARVDQLAGLTETLTDDFAIAGLCLTDYASAAEPDPDYSDFPQDLADILPQCVEGYYKHIVEETQQPISFGQAITMNPDSKSEAKSAQFLPTCFGCSATYSDYETDQGIKDTKTCINILMKVSGEDFPDSIATETTAPSLMEIAFPDGDVDSSIDGVLGLDIGTFMVEAVENLMGPIMKENFDGKCKETCESLDSAPTLTKTDSMTYQLGSYDCSTPPKAGRSLPDMNSQSKLTFEMQLVGGASGANDMKINGFFDYWICYQAIDGDDLELQIITSTSGTFAEPYGARGKTHIDISLSSSGTITLAPYYEGDQHDPYNIHLEQDCVLGLVEEMIDSGSELAEEYKGYFLNDCEEGVLGIHNFYISYPTLCFADSAIELQKKPNLEVPTTIVFPRGDLFTFCNMGLAYPNAITDDNAIICQMGYAPIV